MARFSILLFLAASFFVAIASPIDPNKYPSIALSKKAANLYQTYKRIQRAAALNKNRNDEMFHIMTNQAKEAKQNAKAAYNEAKAQTQIDIKDAQGVIYGYASEVARLDMFNNHGAYKSSMQEYTMQRKMCQSKVDKYKKYIELIETAFENITKVETPKVFAPESSGQGRSRSQIQAPAVEEIVPVEEVVPVQVVPAQVVPAETQPEVKSYGKIKTTINSLRKGVDSLVQKVKNSKSSRRIRSFGDRIRGSNSGSSSNSN